MRYSDITEEIIRISGTDPGRCMKCGKCSASCPAYGEMEYPPHRFVYMIEQGNVEPLLECTGIYRCLSCYACADRCPRGVQPAKLIEAVRVIAERQKDNNRIKVEALSELSDAEMPSQAITTALRKYTK